MAIDVRVNFSQSDTLGRPFGEEGLLAAMQKYDTEIAVLVSSLAVTCDLQQGNRELLDFVQAHDQLFAYLVVNPNYPQESIHLIRANMNSPKLLAVALFHGASRPYPNLDDYRDILSAHRRFTKPVFVHTPTAEAVAAVEPMAQEFPTIKFILGSMGGSEWKRALSCRRQLNIYLETSGSFDAEKIEEAAARVGAHRVLFGSDLPFSDPAPMLALIQSSDLTEEAKEKILGENARRIFSLIPETPPIEED